MARSHTTWVVSGIIIIELYSKRAAPKGDPESGERNGSDSAENMTVCSRLNSSLAKA